MIKVYRNLVFGSSQSQPDPEPPIDQPDENLGHNVEEPKEPVVSVELWE